MYPYNKYLLKVNKPVTNFYIELVFKQNLDLKSYYFITFLI